METGINKNFFFVGNCLVVLERLYLARATGRDTDAVTLLSPTIYDSAADKGILVDSAE